MKTFYKTLFLALLSGLFLNSASYSQSDVNEHSIKFLSDRQATLVGEDGVILRTIDGGVNWDMQSSGVTNVLYGNVIIDDNTSFAVGENGIILNTNDGGTTWNIQTSPVFENLNDIKTFPSTQIMIICGDNGKMLYSDDLGNNWREISTGTTNNLKKLCLNSNMTGFAVGSNSALLKTVDGGHTWEITDMTSFGELSFNSVSAINENKFTIVGNNALVYNTRDGGATWSKGDLPNVRTENYNDIIYFNSLEGVIVGGEGLILKTSDGGATWFEADMNITKRHAVNRDLFAVAFSSPSIGISVGQFGTSYFSNDGGSTWSDVPPPGLNPISLNAKNTPIKLKQNFPNPFNPSTVISYNLPFDASVSLRVYDMLGKEVKSLVSGYQPAGNYNFRFDGSNLSSGIYFYVLRASGNGNEFSKTMRMILTK